MLFLIFTVSTIKEMAFIPDDDDVINVNECNVTSEGINDGKGSSKLSTTDGTEKQYALIVYLSV